MIGIDGFVGVLEEIPSLERESVICSVLENSLKDSINRPMLRDALQEYYKELKAEELSNREPKEILDEYCEIFGFDSLIDELDFKIECEEKYRDALDDEEDYEYL